MAKISDILRSKLLSKAVESSVGHPDANLLAAFAEHTLLERERATVAAHLAQCADCREYLAVASAALEPAETTIVGRREGSRVRNWIWAWRWVATAAVVCLVVAVTWQRHAQLPSPVEKTQPAPAVRPPAAANSVVSEPPKVQPGLPAARIAKARKAKTEPVELALRSTDTEPVRENISPQPSAQAEPKAKALADSYSEPGSAPAYAATPRMNAPAAFLPPAQAPGSSGGVGRAARAVVERLQLDARAPSGVRWSINASPETAGIPRGVLQRTLDGGKTWEIVPVSDRVSFQAVASAGPTVWAGGSDGALFHSSDGGLHWVEVKVAGENAKLTGAIIAIEAENPSRLKITTSSGETWVSSDGGEHWKRE